MTRARVEILAVVMTGLLNIIAYPRYYLLYIALIGGGWGTYLIYSIYNGRYGLSTKKTKKTKDAIFSAWKYTTGVAVLILGIAVLFVVRGWLPIRNPTFWRAPFFWLVLLTYPIFGVLQQYIVQGMLTRNLERVSVASKYRTLCIIGVVALLFTIAHCYDIELAKTSAVLGVVSTWIYLKTHDIMPIGIFHGVFAAVYYYAVMGRDIGWLFQRGFSA